MPWRTFCGNRCGRAHRLEELLRRPGVDYSHLQEAGLGGEVTPQVARQVANEIKYSGYLERQREEIRRVRQHETKALPADLDYARVPGLSEELRQKLSARAPATLGQAKRISGVTPAALSALLVYLRAASNRPRRRA